MQRDLETPQPQPLMTIRQVQRVLGLSRSMVYLLIKRGEIHAIHIGKAVRIKPTEIRRFVQAREAVEHTEQVANMSETRRGVRKERRAMDFPYEGLTIRQ